MRKFPITLLAAASAMSAAFAAEGFSATVDIASSLFSVNKDTKTVDSLVKDADFDNSEFAFSYNGGNWGATFGLGFKPKSDPIVNAAYDDTRIGSVLEFNDVTGWAKFGSLARVQTGKFSSRSVNRRTADINDYKFGVFFPYFKEGEELDSKGVHALSIYGPGSYYSYKPDTYETSSAPQRIEGDLLKNGLLTSLYAGPATFDLLFAPNADLKEKGFSDEKARTYLYGARASAKIGDIAKITGTFKQERTIGTAARLGQLKNAGTANSVIATAEKDGSSDEEKAAGEKAAEWLKVFKNTQLYDNTFGVFAETDAVPGLGITVGYTGYLPALAISNDEWGNIAKENWDTPAKANANHESTLYSGIDLRARYAVNEALSLSTHDNVSFANGKKESAFLGKDASYVSLYNALGATYRLNNTVKLVGEVENEYADYKHKHDDGKDGALYTEYLSALAKGVYAVSANASVSGGLKFEYTQSGDTDIADTKSTVFSVPVGFTFTW